MKPSRHVAMSAHSNGMTDDTAPSQIIYMSVFKTLTVFFENIFEARVKELLNERRIPEGTRSAMIPQVCADVRFPVLMSDEPVLSIKED